MLRNIIHRLQKWWKQMTCRHTYIHRSLRLPGKYTRYKKECVHCHKVAIRTANL